MVTPSGLIELDSGWWVAVGVVDGKVRMQLQYDPRRENPTHGIKDLQLSPDEARELAWALHHAWTKAAASKGVVAP